MKRADILNNLLYNSILFLPKAPPPLDTVELSSDLNKESESVEPVLLNDTTGANKVVMVTATFPSSWLQVTLEAQGKGTWECPQECAQ